MCEIVFYQIINFIHLIGYKKNYFDRNEIKISNVLNWKCHYATACFLMRASPYCWTKLNLFGYLNKNVDRNIVHFECKNAKKGIEIICSFQAKNSSLNLIMMVLLNLITFQIQWQLNLLYLHFYKVIIFDIIMTNYLKQKKFFVFVLKNVFMKAFSFFY